MKTIFRQRLLASTLLVGAAFTASPAFAQASPPSSSEDANVAAADAAAQGEQGDIVVTGSRIARPDLEASSPTVVVGQEEFRQQAGSANIENVLNDLPQVTATTSSTSNNPGGGVATVNLRSLGSARTLVLVDGRRYISYDVSQIVDLNTIPAALIERVDVVTGGQSAVYGSDAIAGVVNFVLKRDFSGVQLDSQYNVTEEGDGQVFDVGLTIGANFADGRGNVTVFGGYTRRSPTFAGDRSFSRFALSDNQDGNPPFAAGGSGSVPQGRINVGPVRGGAGGSTDPILQPGLGSFFNCASTNNIITFTGDGTPACYTASFGYNFAPINYLQVPQQRFLISAMGEYEISEYAKPYFEAQFINNRVNAQLAATPINQGTPFGSGTLGSINLLAASPFYDASLRAALAAIDASEVTCTGSGASRVCVPAATRGNGYVNAPSFSYRTTTLGPRLNEDDRNAYRILGGIKGDFFAGFNYDGYFLYSRTKNSQRQTGNIAIDRFIAATSNNIFLNPLTGATSTTPQAGFQLACGSAAARDQGCVPADIFGQGNISQAALDYIGIGATNLEEYTTQVGSIAFTNNNIYDLGAGGIGLALGAEWRSENGAVLPDQFLASGNVAGFNPGQPTSGGYSVTEFFGELRIPLLRDSFIHRVELNGAGRVSDYSNAPGTVYSWSVGAEVAPVRDLTFRGQYAKTVRGPSVNELFLGNTVSFNGNADRCGTAAAIPAGRLRDICLAQGVPLGQLGNPIIQDPNVVNPLTFVGGNANLREESAKTFTIGAVFQPSFIPRFSATVDYYDIDISGYIGQVGTENIGNLCFVSFNQSYCDLIQRNALGEIDSFTDTLSNSGGLKTSGLDVSAGYFFPLNNFLGAERSRLSFNFTGSYLFKWDYTPVQGLPDVIKCDGRFGANCGVPLPSWRHTLRTTLQSGAVRLSGQWRFQSSVRDDDPDTTYGIERIPSFNYFDATLGFDISDNYELNFGVSNIFDKQPPLAASGQNGGNGEQSNTFPTVFDVLGRSFFVSGRLKF